MVKLKRQENSQKRVMVHARYFCTHAEVIRNRIRHEVCRRFSNVPLGTDRTLLLHPKLPKMNTYLLLFSSVGLVSSRNLFVDIGIHKQSETNCRSEINIFWGMKQFLEKCEIVL